MELLYPDRIAPIVPGNRGTREMLPVVEENGTVIGRASRAWCHAGTMLLHPVVHLQIIDRMGCIYLQRRSAAKHSYPLMWDTAVGGHVSYGEFLIEALMREASEELGLCDFNPVPITTTIYENPTRRELVYIYAAIGHFDLHPDGEEVMEGRWWQVSQIDAALGKGLFTPSFESEYNKVKDSLLSLL